MIEEDVVGDYGKGCRDVQENEDTDVAGVSSNEEIIGDFDKGRSLCCSVLWNQIEKVHRAVGWQLLFPGSYREKEGWRSAGSWSKHSVSSLATCPVLLFWRLKYTASEWHASKQPPYYFLCTPSHRWWLGACWCLWTHGPATLKRACLEQKIKKINT